MSTKRALRSAFFLSTILAHGVLVECALGGGVAAAETGRQEFNLVAQDLSSALQQYALQTGRQVTFSEVRDSGVTTAPLKGSYSPEEALQRLLRGTPFEVDALSRGVLRVHRADQRATIQKIDVELQATPAAPTAVATAAPTEDAGELVVTGSRIVANGYQAPTPVTVVSTAELQKTAPESIPAGLMRLPQFAATAGANAQSTQAGTPSAGNYLNLRRLGSIENLVLLNGQRLPPTSFDGTVDTNIIPQALVQRVDVVTGGASAAYGSDAVSGVINFILNTRYNGVKGLVQTGISKFDDDEQYRFSLTAGHGFAGDRGHWEVSYDHFQQPGITSNDKRPNGANRAPGWVETGAGTLANPFTPTSGVSFGNASYGTLINAGTNNVGFSLRNYTFTPNGQAVPFNPGTNTGTANFTTGGDGGVVFGATLTSRVNTDQGFARLDYDLSDKVSAFAQASFSEGDTSYITVGAGNQAAAFQIFSDNAFLPDFVRQRMVAENIPSFVASRIEADQPPKRAYTKNDVWTFLTGLNGSLGDYKWSATYSYGDSLLRTKQDGNFDNRKWYAALDAVRAPNGNIVCRITITNPGLMDNCVPWNAFGEGSPSQAAYNFILGEDNFSVRNRQEDAAAQISGPIFDLPAGAVSAAVGAEFRHSSLLEQSSTDPSQPISLVGLRTQTSPFNLQFNTTNVGSAVGAQDVWETFGEVAVPILKDAPFAQSLELNGAARYTNYSISGGVSTWKAGATWTPVGGLRVRATTSRDIRAPTLYELFAGTSATRGSFVDVHTGGNLPNITLTQGNSSLKPEIGRTSTAGVIWEPAFVPGFSASVDWFNIKINGSITRLGSSDINRQCEDSGGAADLCKYVTRPNPFSDRSLANFPTSIASVPFNQASTYLHGADFEVNQKLPAPSLLPSESGRLNLRLIGNYTPSFKSVSGPGAAPIQQAGLVSFIPKVKMNWSVDYDDGPMSLGFRARYIGHTQRTTTDGVYYTDLFVNDVTYFDANAAYNIKVGGREFQVYANVVNIGNKFVFIPNTGIPTEFYPSVASLFDVVGRYYTAGLRFNF